MSDATTATELAFAKLEGLGNDFVLIDGRSGAPGFVGTPAAVRQLADRRLGIGFDQLLLLQSASPPALAHVRIFNADGSEAEQCGNGMRALAAWLDAGGQLPSGGADVETAAGRVRLDRAEPIDGRTAWSAELPGLALGDGNADRREIRLGNPHRVLRVASPPDAATLAAAFAGEADAEQVNLGLAYPGAADRIALRVHERGAGPTPACGSGACAAAVAMIDAGLARAPVRVDQPGGSVVVDWRRGETRVRLTGPARVVFQGRIAWPTPTAPN